MTVHRFCRQMNLMRIKQKDNAFPIATRFNENVNRNLSVSSLVEKKEYESHSYVEMENVFDVCQLLP